MSVEHLSAIEARRQAVQAALDASKSAAERNRLGQFATPYRLAVEIARYVKSIAGGELRAIRFVDPAIGTGSFFSAVMKVFGARRIERALGVELDSAFCDTARNLWTPFGLDVVQGDFTKFVANPLSWPAPNLVLANPPYVRHHHLGRQEKSRLQSLAYRLAGVKVSGLAGLYVYFMVLVTAWMKEGGYAAWLVPSEFMDVNYGTTLKRYLTDRNTLIRIHRFDPKDLQFGDALVSSVVVVFRKAPPPSDHVVEFTFGGTIARPHVRDLVALEQVRTSRKWTVYPGHPSNGRRMSHAPNGLTLGDLFRIQRGIATGNNNFFILERREATRLGLPSRYLRPILPAPRFLKTTIIEADHDGYPTVEPQLCVIDCDLPETILQTRYPHLWAYLQTGEAQGIRNGYLVSKRNPWYRQEQRDPAPFLCTYMGRGSDEKRPFRFLWNQSRAIATNLYLMLYPKRNLARLLSENPHYAFEVFTLLSRLSCQELQGEGRVYGGGLNKIEPGELARVSAAVFVTRWPELQCAAHQQAELFDEVSQGCITRTQTLNAGQ